MVKTRLEKHMVCDQCFSLSITNSDCVCSYGKYKTIELEFEVCDCCGHLLNDGSPSITEFNTKQLTKT